MNPDMPFCFIFCRMWDRCIRYPLSQPVPGLRVIPCRFRRRMRCLTRSKGRMLQEIVVDLGGRVAEELVFDDITTGASQDIKQATKMARDMVTRYGMSENIGLICYKDDDDEVFIGRDLAHAHSYSEGIASAIDVEVKRIIDESYEKAKTIIAEHRDVLDRCAALLLEKEKITREEFEALFEA